MNGKLLRPGTWRNPPVFVRMEGGETRDERAAVAVFYVSDSGFSSVGRISNPSEWKKTDGLAIRPTGRRRFFKPSDRKQTV
jgi:hypothetical protein